jgi:Leucine-rich repeat (LRR) protein
MINSSFFTRRFLCILLLCLKASCTLVKEEECVASNTACICTYRPKQEMIEDLLGQNTTPENMKTLRDAFNDMEEEYEQDDLDLSNHTYKEMLVVKCSNTRLTKVPRFKQLGYSNQPYINCLDMKHNNIDFIIDGSLYGLLIKCVDMSHNRLVRIGRNAFSGLLNLLLVIKLNNNRLNSTNTFPIYFASKLTHLQAIFLASNNLDTVYEKSFVGVFSNSLKILDLSSNVIGCIHEDAFTGLTSLRYLNLCNNRIGSSPPNNCTVSTNKLGFLKHLTNLNELRMCNNQLGSLITGRLAFKHSSELKILDLSDNHLTSVYGLFCAISQTSDLSNNEKTKTPTSENENTYLKSLIKLKLGRNKINEITINDLHCMQNLEVSLLFYSDFTIFLGFILSIN